MPFPHRPSPLRVHTGTARGDSQRHGRRHHHPHVTPTMFSRGVSMGSSARRGLVPMIRSSARHATGTYGAGERFEGISPATPRTTAALHTTSWSNLNARLCEAFLGCPPQAYHHKSSVGMQQPIYSVDACYRHPTMAYARYMSSATGEKEDEEASEDGEVANEVVEEEEVEEDENAIANNDAWRPFSKKKLTAMANKKNPVEKGDTLYVRERRELQEKLRHLRSTFKLDPAVVREGKNARKKKNRKIMQAKRANKYRIRSLLRPPTNVDKRNSEHEERRLKRHEAMMRLQAEKKLRHKESAALRQSMLRDFRDDQLQREAIEMRMRIESGEYLVDEARLDDWVETRLGEVKYQDLQYEMFHEGVTAGDDEYWMGDWYTFPDATHRRPDEYQIARLQEILIDGEKTDYVGGDIMDARVDELENPGLRHDSLASAKGDDHEFSFSFSDDNADFDGGESLIGGAVGLDDAFGKGKIGMHSGDTDARPRRSR